MKRFTLSDVRNRHGEVFDHALVEPVLLTKQDRPSHVILSVRSYRMLIDRLAALEALEAAAVENPAAGAGA